MMTRYSLVEKKRQYPYNYSSPVFIRLDFHISKNSTTASSYFKFPIKYAFRIIADVTLGRKLKPDIE